MLTIETKPGFRIGGAVGIIILLLGVAVVFGIYQMSKVSHEIIEISEEYTPLQEIINNIRKYQMSQSINFEKILRYNQISNNVELDEAKERFWHNGGMIESEISRTQNLIQAGYGIANSEETRIELQLIQQKIFEIEILQKDYENLVRGMIVSLEDSSQITKVALLEQIQTKEFQIQSEIDSLSLKISILIDESTNRIEKNESTALLGQVIIILIVGAIAGSLGFFLSQINKELKKEVNKKTLELEEANKKLIKIDKMKDEFIGIASHELKSPIQPIFGFAELAKSGDIDQNEAWDGVTELAKKLQDLANGVLDVSKIEGDQLILHKEKLSINDLILSTTNSLKLSLNNQVRIEEKLDEGIEIQMDRVRIEQVLRNLIGNAIKFTRQGKIIIETHVNREEEKLQVIISDTGLGIPEDILPNIFGKFVTKGHASENQTGTGLGLFVCKGIIESHGGKITARNNKNGGAKFTFDIPITNKKFENSSKIST